MHEFVRAIAEGRKATVDAGTAANWTMTGVCAHESAMRGGERIAIPQTGDAGSGAAQGGLAQPQSAAPARA